MFYFSSEYLLIHLLITVMNNNRKNDLINLIYLGLVCRGDDEARLEFCNHGCINNVFASGRCIESYKCFLKSEQQTIRKNKTSQLKVERTNNKEPSENIAGENQ